MSGFGDGGEVSLRHVARYIPGQYHMTSPPAVIDDIVVVGSSIDDNSRVDMPSGVVRAFDARSGDVALELGADSAQRGSAGKNLADRGGQRVVRSWRWIASAI